MKARRRLTAIAIVISLTLCLTGATAAEYTVVGLFSISYDDTVYTLDAVTYQDDMTDTYRWLFLLYSDVMLIDAGIEVLDGYEDFTLYTATDAEQRSYLKDTLRDDSISYLETLEPSGIPFNLFWLEDGEGPYLLAETVVRGYAIDFYAYYDDHSLLADEALLSALESVIETFVPQR